MQRAFSATSNCPVYLLARDYVGDSHIHQELLAKAIEWVKLTFAVYRKEMKGIRWGDLYDFDIKQMEGDHIKLWWREVRPHLTMGKCSARIAIDIKARNNITANLNLYI